MLARGERTIFLPVRNANTANKSSHRRAGKQHGSRKRQDPADTKAETQNTKSRMHKMTLSVQKVNTVNSEEEAVCTELRSVKSNNIRMPSFQIFYQNHQQNY